MLLSILFRGPHNFESYFPNYVCSVNYYVLLTVLNILCVLCVMAYVSLVGVDKITCIKKKRENSLEELPTHVYSLRLLVCGYKLVC